MQGGWRGAVVVATCVVVALGPACVEERSPIVAPDAAAPGALELIGVSGRRLSDQDLYHVPLDYPDRAIAPDATRREAFVVRNTTTEVATLLVLAVSGDEDGAPADEWRILAPIRARDEPLDASGVRLPPGARLDFDVGVRPRVEGERRATLELVVSWPDRTEVRLVTLRARCARGPP